jgi:hypothetical protein
VTRTTLGPESRSGPARRALVGGGHVGNRWPTGNRQFGYGSTGIRQHYYPMKTTVDLPDGLARRAKEIARAHHISLRELVTEGLRHEVERLSAPGQQPDFRFGTVSGEGLREDVPPGTLTERAYGPSR